MCEGDMATVREGMISGAGNWLIIFHLHSGNGKSEHEEGPGYQTSQPATTLPSSNAPPPKDSIVFPNSATSWESHVQMHLNVKSP